MKKIIYIFLIALLFNASFANAEMYRINSAISEISFKLDHVIGFSSGFVRGYTGQIDIDEKKDEIKSLTIELNMNSVDTFNKVRDTLLKSEDFFNSDSYPKVILTSKKITKDKIHFEVEAKGKKHRVELEYKFLGFTNDVNIAKRKLSIILTGSISRNDFGVTHNVKDKSGKNLLGDDLNLIFDLGAVE